MTLFSGQMLQDALRVLALNSEHALRDIIREELPDPRHERRLARHLLRSPGSYAVQGQTLLLSIREPDSSRFTDAARHLIDRLNALHAPHPALPQLTLRYSLTQM